MPSLGIARSRFVRPVVTTLVGVALAGLLVASGSFAGTHDALIIMGFDPDRSQLIAALLAGAIASGAATLVTDQRTLSALVGAAIGLALFAQTFADETSAALAASGDQGRFDPVGWLLTCLTALVVTAAVAWSATAVAGQARKHLVAAGAALAGIIRNRSVRGAGVSRPLAVGLVALCLAVSLPVFSDMVNFAPDSHMRVGGPPPVGLLDTGPGVPAASGGDIGATAGGGLFGPGPTPTANASGLLPPIASTSTSTSLSRPWLTWRPTGSGRLVTGIHLPPPWTHGSDGYASLTVYLPPGYDASNRRYPVIYEVPWTYDLYGRSVQMAGMLDSLITGGQIPPVIVAFVAQNGAPMPDTECSNSADGRQQIETYMTQTVVAYMDSTYRTVASPNARALFGFSQGGFCAPMLLLRHPDVFGQAIAMSGYYQAALRSGQTVNAALPYAGNQQLIASHSPIDLAASLPKTVRNQVFLVVSGDPTEPFYGPQFQAFAAALKANGFHYLLLPTRLGHAWQAVRATLPPALEAVAGRWVSAGVFATA